MDMKLIDIKDTLPVGFIPIQETVDTRKLLSQVERHLEPQCVVRICENNLSF